MTSAHECVFVTGASGLIGGGVLARMLRRDSEMRAFALVRDEQRWRTSVHRFGALGDRITPVSGDLTLRGLGLEYNIRRRIVRETTVILHAAADTSFSRPLADARLANTEGTRHILDLARVCGNLRRVAYVSTAFVAGRQRGLIMERDNGSAEGWVNAYERSKYEAECLVRGSSVDWTILRPSTVVCRDSIGVVSQINAVHRALRIYHRGLAAMMPGESSDLLDVVTADYVNDAIARVILDPRASGKTFHLCSGRGALTLGELIDSTYGVWARDPAWRKRRVERAILTDLATYTLFTNAIIETRDSRLAAVLASLSHFIPQLALSKRFDTTVADELAGAAAPVSSYWAAMIGQLLAANWGAVTEAAA